MSQPTSNVAVRSDQPQRCKARRRRSLPVFNLPGENPGAGRNILKARSSRWVADQMLDRHGPTGTGVNIPEIFAIRLFTMLTVDSPCSTNTGAPNECLSSARRLA
jgi:hypothetical protein